MYTHVYPIADTHEHVLEGDNCWCDPLIDGHLIIHNSADHREDYETGIRKRH